MPTNSPTTPVSNDVCEVSLDFVEVLVQSIMNVHGCISPIIWMMRHDYGYVFGITAEPMYPRKVKMAQLRSNFTLRVKQ